MWHSGHACFENKKYASYDRFHGNGLYGKIPTKKEPIRTLRIYPQTTLPYNKIEKFNTGNLIPFKAGRNLWGHCYLQDILLDNGKFVLKLNERVKRTAVK